MNKDEKLHHTAGIVTIIVFLVGFSLYISDGNRHREVLGDGIDNPCIAYNC